MAKVLVALTVFLCLGVGGYAGQVWWARHVASHISCEQEEGQMPCLVIEKNSCIPIHDVPAYWQSQSRWYGIWDSSWSFRWLSQAALCEGLRKVTAQDLPDDLSIWESWLTAHPDLRWDGKQGRVVEAPKS